MKTQARYFLRQDTLLHLHPDDKNLIFPLIGGVNFFFPAFVSVYYRRAQYQFEEKRRNKASVMKKEYWNPFEGPECGCLCGQVRAMKTFSNRVQQIGADIHRFCLLLQNSRRDRDSRQAKAGTRLGKQYGARLCLKLHDLPQEAPVETAKQYCGILLPHQEKA